MVFTGNKEARQLRLRFMKIDGSTSRALREFLPLVEAQLPAIVAGFYDHMSLLPSLVELVGDNTERIMSALSRHLITLLSGDFDDRYFEEVLAIGRIHHRIGVEPQWYMGSYNFILGRLIAIAVEQPGWSTEKVRSVVVAVTSAVMLDMELANSVYVEAVIELDRVQQQVNIADAARRQTARLLSGLPATVYSGMIAPDGTVVDFHIRENAQRLSGRPATDFQSWSDWSALVLDIGPAEWSAHFAKVVADGEATIEYDFRPGPGPAMRCRDQVRVIERWPDGGVEIVGYISDVTQDHEIRAQALASSKLATLGEMATGLAHEMNQPITIMSLAAENSLSMLLKKGEAGIPYSIERLTRIKDQAMRARTIVNHLRIFGGQNHDANLPFRLADAIGGALSLVGGALRASCVQVVNEVADDLPPIRGGLVLTEQVLVNLMLNARDAMVDNPPETPRTILLRAAADAHAGEIVLYVSDTGPGIPEALRQRIFEPFFTTKDVGKGTGLGLSICHGIVASFGGSITVGEGPGGGALFEVAFLAAHSPG
jgi:signal transduction histidine kinase